MSENSAMLRICAWCKREIGADGNAVGPVLNAVDEPLEPWAHYAKFGVITHGICRACEDEQLHLAGLHQ